MRPRTVHWAAAALVVAIGLAALTADFGPSDPPAPWVSGTASGQAGGSGPWEAAAAVSAVGTRASAAPAPAAVFWPADDGVLVDRLSGLPVGGADIQVLARLDGAEKGVVGQTQDDGGFRFPDWWADSAPDPFYLRIASGRSDGFPVTMHGPFVQSQWSEGRKVEIDAFSLMTGRVTFEDGSAASDVVVGLQDWEAWVAPDELLADMDNARARLVKDVVGRHRGKRGATVTARTDYAGFFRIAGIPFAGQALLFPAGEAHAGADAKVELVRGLETTSDLEVRWTPRVSGLLIDEHGTPVPHQALTVSVERTQSADERPEAGMGLRVRGLGSSFLSEPDGSLTTTYNAAVVTDADGRFEIHMPHTAQVTILGQVDGFVRLSRTVEADGPLAHVDGLVIQLEPQPGPLRVQLVDEQGRALAGRPVRIMVPNATSAETYADRVTDANGWLDITDTHRDVIYSLSLPLVPETQDSRWLFASSALDDGMTILCEGM